MTRLCYNSDEPGRKYTNKKELNDLYSVGRGN
jgi:hypothetical protein